MGSVRAAGSRDGGERTCGRVGSARRGRVGSGSLIGSWGAERTNDQSAMWANDVQNPHELRFERGDLIRILSHNNDEWSSVRGSRFLLLPALGSLRTRDAGGARASTGAALGGWLGGLVPLEPRRHSRGRERGCRRRRGRGGDVNETNPLVQVSLLFDAIVLHVSVSKATSESRAKHARARMRAGRCEAGLLAGRGIVSFPGIRS